MQPEDLIGRDVAQLVVPRTGKVHERPDDPVLSYRVLDDHGIEQLEVSDYLRHILTCDYSPLTIRSYAFDLLAWSRFLRAVGVCWDRADRVEVRDFVAWRRITRKPARGTPRAGRPAPGSVNPRTGKAYPAITYQPGGINHALAVISEFYAYHLAAGRGPLRNPVPPRRARAGAHHNPMQPFPPGPRAPYRQKQPRTRPRAIPDEVIDELFTVMRADRDRALLAFYLSTGARPSELLGVTGAQVDYGQQLVGVTRKGTRALQWLPASPDAFVWLRLAQRDLPQECLAPDQPIWWTLRRPLRPLTYHAAHRMFERANQRLGANHTLHAVRHTCALRMANDPEMPLVDVQVLLGHARLSSTQDYLHPRLEEIVAHVRAHQARLTEALDRPPAPAVADGQVLGYDASDLETLLGRQVAP